jgi:hypothetical protein
MWRDTAKVEVPIRGGRLGRPPLPTRSLPLSRPARHGVTRATKTSCVLLSPPETPSPTKIG